MTLNQFLIATAGMPGSTELLVLNPYSGFYPAAIVTVEDLVPGDYLFDEFPPAALVITGDAELSLNIRIVL